MKTPKIADFILSTNLADFPLIGIETMRVYFAKNADDLMSEVGLEYIDNSQQLIGQVTSYIFENIQHIENDDDFNIINASSSMDYYLKVFRRYISVRMFIEHLHSCKKMLDREMNDVEMELDKIHEKYKDDKTILKRKTAMLDKDLESLLQYDSLLESFMNSTSSFYLDTLDADLLCYTTSATALSYPRQIKLRDCQREVAPLVIF